LAINALKLLAEVDSIQSLPTGCIGDTVYKIDLIYQYKGCWYGIQMKSSQLFAEEHIAKWGPSIKTKSLPELALPGVIWSEKSCVGGTRFLKLMMDFVGEGPQNPAALSQAAISDLQLRNKLHQKDPRWSMTEKSCKQFFKMYEILKNLGILKFNKGIVSLHY
jgi:hypothetical protein